MRFPRRKPKRQAIYPIHGYSLGYLGSERSPLTWFECKRCGRTRLGGPYELPARRCITLDCVRAEGRDGTTEWVPMDVDGAHRALRAIEDEDIARLVETAPSRFGSFG